MCPVLFATNLTPPGCFPSCGEPTRPPPFFFPGGKCPRFSSHKPSPPQFVPPPAATPRPPPEGQPAHGEQRDRPGWGDSRRYIPVDLNDVPRTSHKSRDVNKEILCI